MRSEYNKTNSELDIINTLYKTEKRGKTDFENITQTRSKKALEIIRKQKEEK